MSTEPAPDLLSLPWRTGRQTEGDLGMGIVYAQMGDEASPDNVLIGMMNSPAMAAEVCAAHNARLVAKLARHEGGGGTAGLNVTYLRPSGSCLAASPRRLSRYGLTTEVVMMLDRSISLVDELRAELQKEKIRLAQLRDEMLTEGEMIVKMDVWEECRL